MWLLVGIQHHEVEFFPWGKYHNLDVADADNIGNIFDVQTWRNILERYGEKCFDCIMTDGGLLGVKRIDEVIRIKYRLLKDDGYILNYTSVIGKIVEDPLQRPEVKFFKIPKKQYTIEEHDRAYMDLKSSTWSGKLKERLKLIV